MKIITLVLLALALSYSAPRAQGRGHAYGRYKHQVRIERVRPAVRTYVRTYTAPRVYRRPAASFSFPSGYSTYQPYRSYYYPYGTITTERYRYIQERRKHEEEHRRFAHERHER